MTSQPTPDLSRSRPGRGSYLLFAAASLWVAAAAVSVQVVAWLADQILIITGIYLPAYAWPLLSWADLALVAVAVVPLAWFSRSVRFRSVYRAWGLCLAFAALVAPARFFSTSQLQPASLAYVVLSLGGCIALVRFAPAGLGRGFRRDGVALLAGSAAGVLVVAPMIVFGALGSLTDTLLTLCAGFSLGLFAGLLLSAFLLTALDQDESKPSSIFVGWSAAVALTILAIGFGPPGSNLLLAAVLPPLGFAVAGIGRIVGAERSWIAAAGLVGAAGAAVLMFFDPTELALVLSLSSGGETLAWALRAAGASMLLGLVLGLIALVAGARRLRIPRAIAASGAALGWVVALTLYVFAGRPGLYGDQLFVILKDQADVGAASSMLNRDVRLKYVYGTLTRQAEQTQAPVRVVLDRLGVQYRPFYLVNAIQVNGGPLLGAFLSSLPQVDRVLDNPMLRPLPAPLPINRGDLPAPAGPTWNIAAIGADRVWSDFRVTGKGIVVGQSDSGVAGEHPALASAYRGATAGGDYNWLDPWNGTRSPTDIDGHGTHTLGTILGRGGIGVAPGAEWIGCVNLARNLGNPGYYLTCMQFMLAPYPQGGDPLRDGDPTRAANVLNNSWGCPPIEGCDPNVFLPAVQALRDAGIFVVVSAGNNGPRCSSLIEPLALYGGVLSVGALDRQGNISIFSSRGPVTADGSHRIKPDLVAPGEEIVSSFPGGTYASEAGTSMAGPHVVGTVALMWSANPKLIGDIARTDAILYATARKYQGRTDSCSDGLTPNDDTGYGIVDAYAAVQAALAAGGD